MLKVDFQGKSCYLCSKDTMLNLECQFTLKKCYQVDRWPNIDIFQHGIRFIESLKQTVLH